MTGRTRRIAELNDELRTMFSGGLVSLTAGVRELPPKTVGRVLTLMLAEEY